MKESNKHKENKKEKHKKLMKEKEIQLICIVIKRG
jgi:hypothetical protein